MFAVAKPHVYETLSFQSRYRTGIGCWQESLPASPVHRSDGFRPGIAAPVVCRCRRHRVAAFRGRSGVSAADARAFRHPGGGCVRAFVTEHTSAFAMGMEPLFAPPLSGVGNFRILFALGTGGGTASRPLLPSGGCGVAFADRPGIAGLLWRGHCSPIGRSLCGLCCALPPLPLQAALEQQWQRAAME